MKIRMKKEIKIATDGIGHVTRTVKKDEVVSDLSDKLSQDFINEDLAELVVEEKKVTTAPNDKSLKSAPDDKGGGKKKFSKKKG